MHLITKSFDKLVLLFGFGSLGCYLHTSPDVSVEG